MTLTHIGKRHSLVDEVIQQLRGDIETRGLCAGDRLPTEHNLIERFGVSRTVLREAISRLEATGLVSIQRGRGTFVADAAAVINCARLMRNSIVVSRDLSEMIELRTALECQAARRAAVRVSPTEIAELQSLFETMCDGRTRRKAVMACDYQFHERIAEIADCELVRTHLSTVREFIMGAILRLPAPEEGVGAMNRRTHSPILEALERRDPEAADQALRLHMQVLGARLCAADSTIVHGTKLRQK